MKKLFLICLMYALLPVSGFSQRTKKPKGPTINVSTTINYYPAIEPYSFFSSFTTKDDDVILTFLTSNSGIFTVEEGKSLLINRVNTSTFPSQLLGVGGSVQIVRENSVFHEISLTKLSFVKSSYFNEYSFMDSLENIHRLQLGYKQNASAFAFRYELGKYFGNSKTAKVRFGISGGIEPSFYFYKRTSLSVSEFPMSGRIFTIDIAVIPMVSAKLSKKIELDFKVIPNILMADFGSIDENNPTVPISLQGGSREYNLPEINLAFSLLLRYNIKEPKK